MGIPEAVVRKLIDVSLARCRRGAMRVGLISLPLRPRLFASATYTGVHGVLQAVRMSSLREVHSDEAARRAREDPESAYLSYVPFVVQLFNPDGAEESALVHDVEIIMKHWTPRETATHDRGLLTEGTIQAGGRGSEGSFVVRFKGTASATIPLVHSWAAERGVAARPMRIAPGGYAEIMFQFVPEREGTYLLDVMVSASQETAQRRVRVAHNLRVLHVESLNWVTEVVGTFNLTRPRHSGLELVEPLGEFVAEMTRSATDSCAGSPQPRRVRVCGEWSAETWG